jgi:hypothetical protein
MLGSVRRLVPIGALLVGLVLALPSAAQVGSGKIAFGTFGAVFTVNPDGSDVALFKADASPLEWSPDGSSAAYLTGAGLMVSKADGSGEHLVESGNISRPLGSWSPDGSRISYTRDGTDVYTASAGGGGERRLTFDGLVKDAPVWSPTGSLLAYSARVQDEQPGSTELFVVGADGTGPTQITHSDPAFFATNDQPAWSPDGSSIAFYRKTLSEPGAIYVLHPDGSDVHRVADASGAAGISAGEPTWSPDGTKIAFTTSETSADSRDRFGPPRGREIYAVNADGSGLTRLTELGPQSILDSSPTWSPDGDLLLFERAMSALYTMNADGSCEGILTTYGPRFVPPYAWQPVPGGAPIGEKRCHAVSVQIKLSDYLKVALAHIDVSVKNEGTEPLTNVTLTAKPGNGLNLTDARAYGVQCRSENGRVTCRLPRLERGQTITILMLGRPRRVGLDQRSRDIALGARFHVSASEELSPTWRETGWTRFQSARCSARDRGAGRIDGTSFPDLICGRRGPDRIHPNAGKDVVSAGAGDDVIYAWDVNADRVLCGPGQDVVIADAKDRVARDCEHVRRHR